MIDNYYDPFLEKTYFPIIEVHLGGAGYSRLYYHVGIINNDNTVSWGPSFEMPNNAQGTNPSVAVANGLVIVVWEGTSGNLWYDLGQLPANPGEAITNWGRR